MSPSDPATVLREATEALDRALRHDGAGALPNQEMQRLFAVLVRAYAAKREQDPGFLPFAREDQVAATEVAVTATGMLEAAEIAVFELGMWQTIKGAGRAL